MTVAGLGGVVRGAVSVCEADDGSVMVSRMNTGLMRKMFGGNIAEVMGEKVSRDEHAILRAVPDR